MLVYCDVFQKCNFTNLCSDLRLTCLKGSGSISYSETINQNRQDFFLRLRLAKIQIDNTHVDERTGETITPLTRCHVLGLGV